MKSWMMQLWLQNHSESEWPDLSISQDGAHVLNEGRHPSKQDIERMCSEDYFAKHNYRYNSSRLSEKDKTLYSSVYSNPIYWTEDETSSNKKMGQNNIVPYDVPGEHKHVIGEINQNRGPQKESRKKASGLDLQDFTIQDKATKKLSKDNKATKMEHGDCYIDNNPISSGGRRRENQGTLALSRSSEDLAGCYRHDMPEHRGENRIYQNVQALRLVHITDVFRIKPTKMGPGGDCLLNSEYPTNTEVTDYGRKDKDYENVLVQRQVYQNGAPQKNTPQNNCLVKEKKGETAPAGRLIPWNRRCGNEGNIQRNSTSEANQPKDNEYAYANKQVTLEGCHLSMEDGHSKRMSASHYEKIEFEYYV